MKRVIGITGGVGSGKSTALMLLKEKYDAYICMADELGHRAMDQGTDAYIQIVKQFGPDILACNGEINRNALADIVYHDEGRLHCLNRIIHPYVKREIRKQMERCPARLFVLETAILFETGCDRLCDEVWGVIAGDEIRIARLMESRGYSREKAESIMRQQMSSGELAERCDLVLVNDGDRQELLDQLENVLENKYGL